MNSGPVSIAISVAALVVSSFAILNSYLLLRRQLEASHRIEFQKMLLDVNKLLVQHPFLYSVYDYDQSPESSKKRSPEQSQQLEAFAYLKTNIMEIVHGFHHNTPGISNESLNWRVWHSYFEHQMKKSSFMRELAMRHDLEEYYTADFCKYLRGTCDRVGQLKTSPRARSGEPDLLSEPHKD